MFSKLSKKFIGLPVVVVALLCGCASIPPEDQARLDARVAQSRILVEPLGLLTVIDDRPEKHKTNKMYSLFIGNCNYGIRRFGDKALFVDRVARLEQALTDALGDGLSDETIRVVRYDFHTNSAVEYMGVVSGITAGATGGVGFASSPAQVPACPRERMAAGWFDPNDLQTSNSPMIVDIEVVVGINTFTVKSAASSVGSPFAGAILRKLTPAGIDAAFDAMDKAHVRLVEKITNVRAEVSE